MTEQHAHAQPPRTTTFNLLFVCTGNTCRSPMAEGIARAELRRRGWNHVQVASAGLAAAEGAEATPEAAIVSGRYGIDLGQHRSRLLTPEVGEWADLILVMGPGHLPGVERVGALDKAATLGDFAAGAEGAGPQVPDPFGGPEAVYDDTFNALADLIGAALDRLAPILAP